MDNQTEKHSPTDLFFSKIQIKDFLSKDDYDSYLYLKQTFSSEVCRNCRNRRVQSFSEILSAIRFFVDKNKEDSWKRSLICGLCWYKNYICINIRQMSNLLKKCKSSINGSFQRLHWIVLQNKQQSNKIIIEAIPYLKNHQYYLKMWSVRQYSRPFQNIFQSIVTNCPQNLKFNYNQHNIFNFQINQNKLFKLPDIKYDHKLNNDKKIESNVQKNNDDNDSDIKDNFGIFDEIDSSEGIFD